MEKELTAEEFFRGKLKEINPIQFVVTLANELISAEQGMRWAKEYSDLQSKSKDDEIAEFKKLVVKSCETSEKYSKMYDASQSRIDELKKVNEVYFNAGKEYGNDSALWDFGHIQRHQFKALDFEEFENSLKQTK